jgi:radical SAM superfamily enzyme YgiQ (UPF0313 family)
MKALLINPLAGFCVFGLEESLRITGKKSGGPPLGLITAAALLPQSWDLRLVDVACRALTEKDWDWADMILLSGNYLHRTSLLKLVAEAKRRGKPVTVGGPYVSSVPEEVLDAGADFVVVGEGENTIPQFVDALKAGKRSGVFRNEDKPDMAASPIPRFDLLNSRHYQHGQIQTARGCPFNCEFCDIITLYGRVPRFKPPSQVISELESLYRLGWRGPIFVADDNFIGNKQHARDTLEQMIQWQESRGKPFSFFTQASVNLGQDRELIDLLTAARFGNIFVGVESPDQEVLTRAGKSQNVRHPLVESLDTINRNGLPVLASFVIGFDGETQGAGDRIAAFMEETSIPVALLGTLWALPNTALWHRLKQEGRLLELAAPGQDFIGGTFNFVPSRPESEIRADYARAWDLLYEPSRFLGRAYRYFLSMRPTRKALSKSGAASDRPVTAKARAPLRDVLLELRALIILCWRLGVRSNCKLTFWKQMVGMLRKNPSRLRQYIVTLGYGPDLFRVREMILAQRRAEVSQQEVTDKHGTVAVAR